MTELCDSKCEPCQVGAPKVDAAQQQVLLQELPDWLVVIVDSVEQLTKAYRFKNFVQAIEFTNQIAEIAELADHHPALLTEWGKVTVSWWTHKIDGLHQNDFILAARTEEIYRKRTSEALANI